MAAPEITDNLDFFELFEDDIVTEKSNGIVGIPAFISKLVSMVSDPKGSHIISWSPVYSRLHKSFY